MGCYKLEGCLPLNGCQRNGAKLGPCLPPGLRLVSLSVEARELRVATVARVGRLLLSPGSQCGKAIHKELGFKSFLDSVILAGIFKQRVDTSCVKSKCCSFHSFGKKQYCRLES